jgi:hypothetical protein
MNLTGPVFNQWLHTSSSVDTSAFVAEPSDPDMASEARSSFGTASNRYDTLKRGRLPLAMYSMELEWRDHPVAMCQRLILTNNKLAGWLFFTFLLVNLVIAPVVGLYGRGLVSAVTYPVLCFVCALAAYYQFARTASLASAVRRFIFPQGIAVLIEWAFSSGINPWWSVAPVFLAMVVVGLLADRVNTHYVRWITANLQLKREAVLKRREMWNLRFHPFALTREISAIRQEIEWLEANGAVDQAFALRRRAGELLELREYPLGFLILLYLAVLLYAGAPPTVLILSGFGVAAFLAFRRPLISMKLGRLISEVNIHSYVSWFSWDLRQDWTDSPGMFRDGLYSKYRRLTQTIVCFGLIQLSFVSPMHLWGIGELLTPSWLWTTAYHFFANLLLPPFFLTCTLVATGARPLWMHLEAIEWADASEELDDTRHYWDAVAGRLQNSENPLEREHIWLGTHAEYGHPVLLHRKLLKQHVHIQGGSGTHKTSRILTPLEASLIRNGDGAVIVMDLKRETSHLEGVRREAKKAGKIFKQFTNVLGLSSYLFNPFQHMNVKNVSIAQIAQMIMESLRLNHGDGYGKRYFSVQSLQWLSRTLKAWPNLSSFEELYAKATPEFFKNEAEMDRCRELISVIEQVAQVVAMNWKPGPGESDRPLKDAIFMPDVIEQGQVVYFSLPAIGETSTVKEIANLVLYSLIAALKTHHEQGGRKQTYLIIDEFQQMASEGFKLILRQGREFGVSLILSNQSDADLMTQQTSRLLDVIRTNTQVKIFMSVTEMNTIKMLEKASGLIPYAGIDGMLDYRPRLTINDIQSYSAHPDYAICWITRDSGFTAYGGDWFGLRTDFHITEEEFKDRDAAPWPEATESTIVAKGTRKNNRSAEVAIATLPTATDPASFPSQ